MRAGSVAAPHANSPVRGTQLLVEHISDVFRRPSLLAIEIAWRWLFGIPFLMICWKQAQQILAAFPLESSGLNSLDTQNPWVAAEQLVHVFSYYQPHVLAVLRWLLPAAGLAWAVVSGVGRNLELRRIASIRGARLPFRPVAIIVLRGGLLALLVLTLWGWFGSMEWVAATHISGAGEPDLVGYFIWAIFLSLAFFTAFALASWPLSVAPVLVLFEKLSAISVLRQSLKLGKPFSSKLAEINLVLGIVKLALIVLAMVFSAAPLPFSDELGAVAVHDAMAVAIVWYLLANDFFQVVRLVAFVEFWKVFREQPPGKSAG